MFASAAGQVYALSDMALCVGFAVGPILGPLLQEAFGGGERILCCHCGACVSCQMFLRRFAYVFAIGVTN